MTILRTFILSIALAGMFFFPGTAALFADDTIAPSKVAAWLMKQKGTNYDKAVKIVESDYPEETAKILSDFLISEDEDTDDKLVALSGLKLFPVARFKDYYIAALERTKTPEIKKQIILIALNALDKAFVVPVSKELESPYSEVRESAITCLRDIGDDRMLPVIFKIADNKDPVYRYYAIEAIVDLYDIRLFSVVQNLLSDESKSVRIRALQCAERNNLDKLIPNIRKMAQSDINNEVRIASVQILGKFNDSGSLSVFTKTLTAPEQDLRLATAQVLVKMKLRQSAPAVSEQLAVETDNTIKNILIEILIDMRDGGNFKGLDEMINRETYLPLRIKSVYALSVIGGTRSIPILLRALKDRDVKVRAEAAGALSSHKDKQVTSALVSAVNEDTERYVRLAALFALEKIRDRSSVIPLIDQFYVENDPVFRFKLYQTIRVLAQ
jgi:HEAT repeat protein